MRRLKRREFSNRPFKNRSNNTRPCKRPNAGSRSISRIRPPLARAKYITRPPTSAITLISNGRLKPCQMARWVPSKFISWVLARVVLLTRCSTSRAGNRPTAIHKIARIRAGARMPIGGSCASLLGTSLPIGPSKNTPCTKRTE